MKRFLPMFVLIFTSCSPKVSEWHEVYKYEAPAGWNKSKYEREKFPEAFSQPPPAPKQEQVITYEKERLEVITKLLRTPPTPMKVPDTVVRVLILPWVDKEGNLNTSRYIFFKVEEGKWILGDYLLKSGEPIRELKPLEK